MFNGDNDDLTSKKCDFSATNQPGDISSRCLRDISFGNQTWLAGNSPRHGSTIFQLSMFDGTGGWKILDIHTADRNMCIYIYTMYMFQDSHPLIFSTHRILDLIQTFPN